MQDTSLINEAEDQELISFADMMSTPYPPVQLQGIIGVRRFLSSDENPPIQKVIDACLVPRLLEFMIKDDDPIFQYESTWAISNICAGASEHVQYLVDLGIIDIIISQLHSNSEEVVDQAFWAAANITGDNLNFRDMFLEKGCIDILLEALKKFEGSYNILKSAAWTLSNLTRGKPYPQWDYVSKALPFLNQIIKEVQIPEVVSHALWSIAYLSDLRVDEIMSVCCVPSIVNYFCDNDLNLLAPSVRALGNLVSGEDDRHTQTIVNCPEFIPRLFDLLTHRKQPIKKEAFWTLSNIAAGTQHHIDLILKHSGSLQALKRAIKNETFDVAHEALLVLSNMISGASDIQLNKIIKGFGYHECFKAIIKTIDFQSKRLALECIFRLLSFGRSSTNEGLPMEILQDEVLVEKLEELFKKTDLDFLLNKVLNYFEPFKKEKQIEEEDEKVQGTEVCADV